MSLKPLAAKAWLENDPERIRKFSKGIPGKTSDRWLAKPNIKPCWRSAHRTWRIDCAKTYQRQLFCGYWKKFINPSGFSCFICQLRKDDKTPPDGKYFPE